MKNFLLKSSLVLCFTLLFAFTAHSEAKTVAVEGWTYSTVINGVTYKLYLVQEKGTWTIQVYDSRSNKWVYAQVLSSNPDTGYWRIKDGAGVTWDLTTYDDNTAILTNVNTGKETKYWME